MDDIVSFYYHKIFYQSIAYLKQVHNYCIYIPVHHSFFFGNFCILHLFFPHNLKDVHVRIPAEVYFDILHIEAEILLVVDILVEVVAHILVLVVVVLDHNLLVLAKYLAESHILDLLLLVLEEIHHEVDNLAEEDKVLVV